MVLLDIDKPQRPNSVREQTLPIAFSMSFRFRWRLNDDDSRLRSAMGTVLYYQPIASPSNTYGFNETLIDYGNQNSSGNIDQPIHLLSFIAIWIILLVTIIFGATGNVLVLYVYTNRKDNKTCTFFIKVLAVVDLSICLILAPLELFQTTIGKHECCCPLQARTFHRGIRLRLCRHRKCSVAAAESERQGCLTPVRGWCF